jgi:hypothetical protein
VHLAGRGDCAHLWAVHAHRPDDQGVLVSDAGKALRDFSDLEPADK